MEGSDDADDFGEDGQVLFASSDWAVLRSQVLEATVVHMFEPSVPHVKIGRFDAIACIGEGGFGTVFKANDPKLNRQVALKLCRTRSPGVIEAITEEAKALAKLDHPNIVTVHEPGEHDGGEFFVMQYIDGGNAQEFGRREPPPTWQQVVDVYRGVGRGLAAAHDAHIVHGDIKPSNILLDQRDFPRLADFGLARRIVHDAPESDRDALRHRAGTLAYMAPEVLRGQSGEELADQWSFCVSLRHTLAGTPPFSGDTSGELLDDIAAFREEILVLTEPEGLREVLRRGLAMDPRERFPDMHALGAALDRLREPLREAPEVEEPGDELESPPDEPELMPLSVGPSPAKRRAFAASLLLVGMVGLTLGWVGRGRVEGPRPSDPVPLPSLPCALGDDAEMSSVDVDPQVLAACTYIRQGRLIEAHDYWGLMYASRRKALQKQGPDLEDSADELAADTLIVVETFRDQAKRLRQSGKYGEAHESDKRGAWWTPKIAAARALGDAKVSTDDSSDSSIETTN